MRISFNKWNEVEWILALDKDCYSYLCSKTDKKYDTRPFMFASPRAYSSNYFRSCHRVYIFMLRG